jgi:low affinity Fe/Cu permease
MSAISFVLLFVIQYTTSRDTKAISLKIDELILRNSKADNRLIGVEHLDEALIDRIAQSYHQIAAKEGSRNPLDEKPPTV